MVVVVLPLISAALILFFGKRTPARAPSTASWRWGGVPVLARFLWHFVEGGGPFEGIDWFTIGPLHLELGILVDGLTGIMLVVVTSISLCVHIYSLGYMHGERAFTWFYVVLSLFTAAMLTVVVSNNVIQLLVGFRDHGRLLLPADRPLVEVEENSNAAIKAFITTRVGDIPFMFGVIMLIALTGFIHEHHRDLPRARPRRGLTAVHLDRRDPAVRRHGRKSAQFPLHVWLPDAMAGPRRSRP